MSSIFVVPFQAPQADPRAITSVYYWKEPQDTSSSAQETNQHFIGRFTQPQFARFNYNQLAVDVPAAVQPETNTHFVGKFTQPQFARFNYNTAAFDFSSSAQETNQHFIGRFTQPVFARFGYNVQANDVPVGPSFETNVHFLGRFTQPVFNVLASLRQTTAQDFSSTNPTQPTQAVYNTMTLCVMGGMFSIPGNPPS